MKVFNPGFRWSWLICIIIVVLVVIVNLIEAYVCFSWKLFLNFLMKRWRKINNGTIQIMKCIKILSYIFPSFISAYRTEKGI